jgi:hypothetical protein
MEEVDFGPSAIYGRWTSICRTLIGRSSGGGIWTHFPDRVAYRFVRSGGWNRGEVPTAATPPRIPCAQTCALTLDLYERGRGCGCHVAAGERAALVCEVGGPSLYRRSRCGAGGLIGAAAAHSSPGQANARCRSKVGARGKRFRAAGPCVLARVSRIDSGQAGCASSSCRTL